MSWYCDYAIGDDLHGPYHDKEYGFPICEENQLFERLVLEINQAGLNWGLILKKKDNFHKAYDGFDVDIVSEYSEKDRARLLEDEGIIRNKLKVNAVIENAKTIKAMRDSHGGFDKWIASHHPLKKSEWVKLFKKTFKFTGGEITGEFLMSIGYLPGTHSPECPIYKKIEKLSPAWMAQGLEFYQE
ncbi:DNA-3-methyladenine glycosylase I [Curvivirga aplysinae]|uniref:DNA-3-methyladenine glycosylase I n=1 Tax=Curvivirga aplysinae TaxID=2529852 RepID=UPI0012BBB731|nr:DNA-3-methyladenine glycosylase I [Curvivirga aplysinae]MTI09362.1 DNA-3-methyladenine glycosylase I [Curvivirga aplysinae]